ncbi:SusC/RagA family TonB-linked outer membrane protein [uncultured Chitinophaga sp.]|uniref:SusC/RagA family TonB-linked outer membrane protein n=1 Tax=uncultured Chitinophaga sp. TaxID=339340 RepID=UPI0025E7AFBB|nr:SusC/RagA family TonB-linked outer membrane protein [uncultured Chitinophaga sp.]
MKLTFLLLTVAILGVHASGRSQSVSLSGKDLPIKRVISAIEKQTGYVVFYNRDLLNDVKPITVDAHNMPLAEFLSTTLSSQPLNYRITDKMITFSRKPAPPEVIIETLQPLVLYNGQVLNSTTKEPVVAATVTIKGHTNGTITDSKGLFNVNVEPGTILVISSLGYQTVEYKTKRSETNFTISLSEKVAKLAETVVTAFGIEKSSKEIGYSVDKISGEEINRANSGNVLAGLQGKVSGLNITTQNASMTPQMRVLLRGIRSFGSTSNNQPLFILNGTPLTFGSDNNAAALVMDFINNINPADIQDVTVLKGANGTALYGPEGVNGVILITTKKGMKGRAVVNFRNSVSFQHMDYRNDKAKQRSFGTGLGTVDADGNGLYSTTDRNGWGPKYNGELVKIGRPDENGEYQMVTYADRQDARRFFAPAMTVQNNLSVSQSDDKSDFYLGLNHSSQDGFIPADKRKNLSLFLTSARRFGKYSAQVNISYSCTTSDLGPDMRDILSTPTFIPLLSYKDWKNDKWSDNNHYWSDEDVMSPYQAAENNRSDVKENAMVTGLVLTAKVLPWLTITEKPSVVYSGKMEKGINKPVNFSDFAKLNGGWNRWRDQLTQLTERSETNTTLNNDFLITALNRTGYFTFRTTLGSSVRESFLKKVSGSGNPIIPVFNLSFSREQPYGSEQSFLTRFYSFFGTSTIGWKDRAFVELTARNDWDSKRAKVGRGKDLYLGANSSVILNELVPSLSSLPWLSRLQLRAAVNGTANMNILPYQAERTLFLAYSNGFPYPGTTGEGVLSYNYTIDNPNPFLKPERIISQEYGALFSLWKDRVVVDVSYYTQRNNGVIMQTAIPWLSGGATLDNLGVLRNFGYEVDIKLNPLFRLDNGLTVTADLRFAKNDNKVISVSEIYDGQFPMKKPNPGDMYGLFAREGGTAFEFQTFDWKRDPQGRVIVNKTTGMPDTDLTKGSFTGRTLPKYTGGASINLNWKGFSLAVLGEFNAGASHYFRNGQYDLTTGMSVITTYNDRKPFIVPNSVYDDGGGKYVENSTVYVSNTNRELYSHYENTSTLFLTSANFLKIREIVLAYEYGFRNSVLKKLMVSAYGRNLYNWYAKDNIYGDPDLVNGPGSRGYRTLPANLEGATSGVSTVPGVLQFGFITTLTF